MSRSVSLSSLPAKRLCAHRGLHGAAVPENSLPALAAAAAVGAAEVEFDIWWTRDQVPVVIHDVDLARVAGVDGRVPDMTLEELRAVDFGAKYDDAFSGMRVATFDEALDQLDARAAVNLHLKDDGGEWDEARLRAVLRAIDRADARRCLYFMFSGPALHAQFARLAPDIPRCMGSCNEDVDIVEIALRCGCAMVQLFKGRSMADVTEERIERAHAAGLRVNVFWSDDPAEARRFFDMGADTVLTNRWSALSRALSLR